MKMLKKIFRRLGRIENIDTLVYVADSKTGLTNSMAEQQQIRISDPVSKGKKEAWNTYYSDELAHTSNVFKGAHVLTLVNEKGPVIGDCFTMEKFRGRSLYPYTLDAITKRLLQGGHEKVFILVAPDNLPSVRGIEKAGFERKYHIRAKRYLLFYFNVNITS
jgi:RimJ/RimL family protein N-acetyltransferase